MVNETNEYQRFTMSHRKCYRANALLCYRKRYRYRKRYHKRYRTNRFGFA